MLTRAEGRAERPLAILGPTASGKSTLGLEIAREIGNAEIVSADSMAVYRKMDIGTATPSSAQQREIPHHLLNVVDASEEFTVGAFKELAVGAIADIRAKRKVPILVGGTGLYLRALVDDLNLPGRYPEVLAELELEDDTKSLHARLALLDPKAASKMEPTNRRRVIRALEVTIGSGKLFSSYGPGLDHYGPTPFVMVALRWPEEELKRRIAARYRQQIEAGFVEEVRALSRGTLSRTASQALGYREFLSFVVGECTQQEALDLAIQRTQKLARRQLRWFRRDPRIVWLDAPISPHRIIEIWDKRRSIPIG